MRKILTQQEADDILKSYYDKFSEVFIKSHSDLQRYLEFAGTLSIPHMHERKTKSMIMWNYAINHANYIFRNDPNVKSIEYNGICGLLFYEALFIRFKKLNDRHKSSNIPTFQSITIDNQGHLEGFPERPTILQAGYIIDKSFSQINTVLIVCPNGTKSNHWEIDVLNKLNFTKELFDYVEQPVSPSVEKLLKIKESTKSVKHVS